MGNEYDKGKGIDRDAYTCPECSIYLMESNFRKGQCPFGHKIEDKRNKGGSNE